MTAKLWALLIGLALMAGGIWGAIAWHDNQKEALYQSGFDAGKEQVQKEWDAAIESARTVQADQNESATGKQSEEVQTAKTIYIDRIREVTKYAPAENSSCPADPDFVRLFNDGGAESRSGGAEDQ